MLKLSEKNENKGNILKCGCIPYSPSEITTISAAISQVYINIHREDCVISLLNSYIDLNFDVLHAATNNRYADGDNIRLDNLGPIALFSNFKVTTRSRRHWEDIIYAHIVSLMYKLIISSGGSDDLSIGFDRDCGRKLRELSKNKNQKGKDHVRIYLKDVFGFAEHHVKASYGVGYKISSTRKTDNAVLSEENATNIGRNKIIAVKRHVP